MSEQPVATATSRAGLDIATADTDLATTATADADLTLDASHAELTPEAST